MRLCPPHRRTDAEDECSNMKYKPVLPKEGYRPPFDFSHSRSSTCRSLALSHFAFFSLREEEKLHSGNDDDSDIPCAFVIDFLVGPHCLAKCPSEADKSASRKA